MTYRLGDLVVATHDIHCGSRVLPGMVGEVIELPDENIEELWGVDFGGANNVWPVYSSEIRKLDFDNDREAALAATWRMGL